MPSFGAQSAQQNNAALNSAVGQAAPLAPQWHGVLQTQAPDQVFNQVKAPSANTGIVSKFAHFVGGVATETAHVAEGAASLVGHSLASMGTSVVRYPEGIYRGLSDRSQINQTIHQTQQNSAQLDNLHNLYKSGRINKADYQSGLNDLIKQENQLTQGQVGLDNRVKVDQQNAVQSTIDLSSAILTVATLGTGAVLSASAKTLMGDTGVKAATDFLTSSSAESLFAGAESALKNVAADKAAFEAISPAAQNAARTAVLGTVQNAGTRITAGQLARSAAIKLAFTAPLTYSALSQTGTQLYNELDQQKYGSAVRTAAFNAALFLVGGPIGHALGKMGAGAKSAVFGQTSFWDELSKYYGNGSADGFTRAVQSITSKMTPEDAKQYVQNLSAVEATNVKAMGGNVADAAARIAGGMKNVYGFDLNTVDHETALQDMAKFAKNQRLASDTAKQLGMKGITAGRFDARDKNLIAARLAPAMEASGSSSAHQAWEDLKTANPNQSWSNNINLDKQIKDIIDRSKTSGELDQNIRSIKAAFTPKGFPSFVAKEMAKDGYIPIKPSSLEAPFQEGTGKFGTKFSPSNDFFVQTVKPLPVLNHLGDALTNMGLSPNASTNMIQTAFNTNLTKNLIESGVGDIGRFAGEEPEQTAQTWIKQLSDYAKAPTRGGMSVGGNSLRPPITDLRQLTTKDIMSALEVSSSEAKKIGDAISGAMLQVPLSIRGMGDRLVDYARNVPGFNRYLGLQGAARFAWNPFFKIKLTMKTESLSQLESGGKILTLPGTNTMIRAIAPETYGKIEQTRSALRDAGVFEEKGKTGFAGAEGFSDTGAMSSNLSHKLLPSQERSISSLIIKQAEKAGMTPEQFVHTNPQEIRDSVQAIVGYDRNANFLNSPMARTINYAFFPFRFNLKVAGFMARSLTQQPAIVQFAVLHGLYNASNWLNSQEGQAWYSRNSDVIGLMKYFTPLETIGAVASMLGQQPHSISNFGELGGLPFGFIPQLLDAEGITHGLTQSPYVSPKTGDAIPSYIPATSKGQLLVAIQEMLGAIYTYPGSTVGLPSKSGIDRNIAIGLTQANKKTDLQSVQPPIPPGLQNFSAAVKSTQQTQPQTTQQQQQALPKNQQPTPSISPDQTQAGQQVPVQSSPALTTPNKGPASSKAKTTKLKKSQYKPALLPGQTQYGQL
jgi:hypothetical protein